MNKTAFDKFVKTGQLSGPIRLLSDIADTFATPRIGVNRIFWGAKVAVGVAVSIRRYQLDRQAEFGVTTTDLVNDWVEQNDYVFSDMHDDLDNFVVHYVEDLPFEMIEIGGSAKLRKYSVGEHSVLLRDERHYKSVSPIFKGGTEQAVLAGLREQVWSKHNNAVRLVMHQVANSYGGMTQHGSLVDMPEIGDHVSAGAEDQQIQHVVTRTRRFLDVGRARRILLHGPPGVGKSTLATRIVRALGELRVFYANNDTRSSLWPQYINALRPDAIIIDDFDRVDTSKLLQLLEQLDEAIVLIGTVNSLSNIDPALLRPGRFDEVITIGLPSRDHSDRVVEHYCDKLKIEVTDHMKESLAGISPASIREVLLCVQAVGMSDFDYEVARIRVQEDLHGGDACEQFLAHNHASTGTAMPGEY